MQRERRGFLQRQWIQMTALASFPSKFIESLLHPPSRLLTIAHYRIMGLPQITFIGLRLKMWLRRARTMIRMRLEYRPGGAGYLRARESFQIRAGQRRATRRFRPY